MRDRGISKYLGLGDEHASRLAVTVFEFQRHEASNRAAAAVCPCGPMARATQHRTSVSGTRARRRRCCGSIWQQWRGHSRDIGYCSRERRVPARLRRFLGFGEGRPSIQLSRSRRVLRTAGMGQQYALRDATCDGSIAPKAVVLSPSLGTLK
jgi:hypothetical protein